MRYKTKEVLRALDRRETVILTYRGKTKGRIIPANAPKKLKAEDHPLFNSAANGDESVDAVMNKLRAARHVV